jgi:hypothetical protein
MSTKTLRKRIALVAVSAMGFGLLSVVPASATSDLIAGEASALTIATSSTGRIGTASTAGITLTLVAASTEADESTTLRGRFTSKPAGSTATVAFTGAKTTYTAAGAAGNELFAAKAVVALGNLDADASETADSVGFIPDVAGSYTVQVWVDLNNNGAIDSDESALADTETFTVAGSPTTVAITKINGTAALSGTYGSLVKLTLTNAAGAAGLAAGESVTVDPSGTTANITINGDGTADTAVDGAAATLTAADFVGGIAWINVANDAAASETVTLTIAGVGTDIASLSGTTSILFKLTEAVTEATTISNTSGVYDAGADNDGPFNVPLGASTVSFKNTVTYGTAALATAAVGTYLDYTVVDVTGYVTGSYAQAKYSLGYDGVVTLAAGATTTTNAGSFSVTTTSLTGASQYTVTTSDADISGDSVTSAASAVTNGSVTASPAALNAAPGGTVSLVVTVEDQYGAAPSGSVTMSISGRNTTVAATQVTKTLDANGQATFSIKDAPAAGVTATVDSVSFTAYDAAGNTKAASGAASITWVAQSVGTVVLTGGNTTAGVTATTVSNKDISAGDGAETAVQAFSATVKDAAGNLLTGTTVTWTISGTGAAVDTTQATSYTSALGVATTEVYGWLAGTYTVTATAGGVSGTGTITFAQTAAGEERTISATAEGAVVSAKVVDRFGNPVPGVTVYATKSGVGYFGAGVTKTSTTTNASGIAEFVIAGGSATVTVSTISYDAVAGTYGSGQTSAPKGYLANAATATALAALAFTAYTAGTTLEAAEGVGASYDAAGVSSAVVGVEIADNAAAANDAAAEATDAANAATDAANAAAEAADAATAAAQDAADAVAALSAQVATLISGLKSQLTALTNLVIKIQKKVKA